MAEPHVAEVSELGLRSFRHAVVLATIIEKVGNGVIGVRMKEIVMEVGLLDSKAEEIIAALEGVGLVTSKVLQVGTGGTHDRFYMPAIGVSVKVFGPPLLKKF